MSVRWSGGAAGIAHGSSYRACCDAELLELVDKRRHSGGCRSCSAALDSTKNRAGGRCAGDALQHCKIATGDSQPIRQEEGDGDLSWASYRMSCKHRSGPLSSQSDSVGAKADRPPVLASSAIAVSILPPASEEAERKISCKCAIINGSTAPAQTACERRMRPHQRRLAIVLVNVLVQMSLAAFNRSN